MDWFSAYGTRRIELQGPAPQGFALLLLGPYLLAGGAFITLLPPVVAGTGLAMLVPFMLRAACLYLRPGAPRRVTALALGPDGDVSVCFADGSWGAARLCQHAMIPGVCLLALDSGRGRLFVPVPRRQLPATGWRQLRGWLQYGQPQQGGDDAPQTRPAGLAERLRRLRMGRPHP